MAVQGGGWWGLTNILNTFSSVDGHHRLLCIDKVSNFRLPNIVFTMDRKTTRVSGLSAAVRSPIIMQVITNTRY